MSIVTPSRSIPRGTLPAGSLAAPQERAHAREQLAGAERLREVVVGAEIQRGDLVRLLVANGQHDDGHAAPARIRRQHSSPSITGMLRSRMTGPVPRAAARSSASAPSLATTTAYPRAPANVRSPADLRLVVDHQDRGHAGSAARTRTSRHRPACPRARAPLPIRSTNPFAIARPSPGPSFVVRSSSRENGRNSCVRAHASNPAPVVDHAHADYAPSLADRPRPRPCEARHARRAGRVVQQVRQHPRQQHGIGGRSRMPSSIAVRSSRRATAWPRRPPLP